MLSNKRQEKLYAEWCAAVDQVRAELEWETPDEYVHLLQIRYGLAFAALSKLLENAAWEKCLAEQWWKRWLRRVTGSALAQHELVLENHSLLHQLSGKELQLQAYRDVIVQMKVADPPTIVRSES